MRVHGSVNRILGMNNMLAIPKDKAGNFGENQALFTFENLTHDLVVVEQFFQIGGWDRPNVIAFENKTKAVVVLRNINLTIPTKVAHPEALWFFDDVCPGRHRPLEIGKDERIYARQFNPESPKPVMIHVKDGGLFWCLGFKTEGRATHAIAENGAQVEILGGVAYQSWGKQELDPPMFIIDNARMSFSLGFYHHKDPFSLYVKETQGTETKELPRQGVKGKFLPVYRSGQ
ncbi:MAG: hypothetical protein HC904_04130 [Blastochloris sp.]|nr:hypothetical protein [Blastochloris sp.]